MFLVVGCGGSGSSDTGEETHGDLSRPSGHQVVRKTGLTRAVRRRLKAIVMRDANVRRITAGRQVELAGVIPWSDDEGQRLLGGEIDIDVRPPLRLTNERLPGLIFPNHKAPPGTPTLHRNVLISASNVSKLRTLVSLDHERAVEIDPEGEGVRVTKRKLIGPAPKDPAYRSEPGY
jgi:hypothetical protein